MLVVIWEGGCVEKSVLAVMSWHECRGRCYAKEILMSQIVAADNKRRASLTSKQAQELQLRAAGLGMRGKLGPPLGCSCLMQPDDC